VVAGLAAGVTDAEGSPATPRAVVGHTGAVLAHDGGADLAGS